MSVTRTISGTLFTFLLYSIHHMFGAAILATVSAVFTVSGYANNAAGLVNLQYDQEVVQESLTNMQETQQLLLEKAKQETDPAKRRSKLLAAKKLGQTHQDLDRLQSELVVKTVRKEAAGLAKNLLSAGGKSCP